MTEDPNEIPLEERVDLLTSSIENAGKQMERLTEQLMGTIVILCLPMTSAKKLEFGFKSIEKLPNHILKIIIRRYVEESKKADMKFDEMVDPLFLVFGFEKLWKLLDRETIKEFYGEWALNSYHITSTPL